MKFLSKTVTKFLMIGTMLGIAFFSLAIWIPQLQAIVHQADIGKGLGKDNWFTWAFSLFDKNSSVSNTSVIGILLELYVVVAGAALTILLILRSVMLLISSNKRSKKKKYIGTFISLFILMVISIYQMATKINSGNLKNPFENLSIVNNVVDDALNKFYFNSIDVFGLTLGFTLGTTVLLVIYMFIFKFLANKINDKIEEKTQEKKLKKRKEKSKE